MIKVYFNDKNGHSLGSKIIKDYSETPQKNSIVEIIGNNGKTYKGRVINKEYNNSFNDFIPDNYYRRQMSVDDMEGFSTLPYEITFTLYVTLNCVR